MLDLLRDSGAKVEDLDAVTTPLVSIAAASAAATVSALQALTARRQCQLHQAVIGFTVAAACTALLFIGCLAASIVYGAIGGGIADAVEVGLDGGSYAAPRRAFFADLGPGALAGALARSAAPLSERLPDLSQQRRSKARETR